MDRRRDRGPDLGRPLLHPLTNQGEQTITNLEQLRDQAAEDLADLVDSVVLSDSMSTHPRKAVPAVDAIGKYAIALAVDRMADITRQLIIKHAQNPILPNQTRKDTKP